jgi:hypothetical protein
MAPHEPKIFTRSEVSAVVDSLVSILPAGDGHWCKANGVKILVSRRNAATIRFESPPTADEWDALLAHIAFYKTWWADDEAPRSEPISTAAIISAIERGVGSPKDTKDG